MSAALDEKIAALASRPGASELDKACHASRQVMAKLRDASGEEERQLLQQFQLLQQRQQLLLEPHMRQHGSTGEARWRTAVRVMSPGAHGQPVS